MQWRREGDRAGSPGPSAVLITFVTALLAGAAGVILAGLAAWVWVGAITFGGAYLASRISRGVTTEGPLKARRLLLMLDRGGSQETKAPAEFTEEWGTLYERLNKMAFEARTSSTALAELERYRKQADLAASILRDGKDPLTEAPELRVGPLQSLLEGIKTAASTPVVSRLPLGEEELIGADGEGLPPTWPKPTGESSPRKPEIAEGVARGLRQLVQDLEALAATLGGEGHRQTTATGESADLRTPAQLVDAVVLTAADGIEDLAAGLMRANELASIAERVTNRATLLALNAALEATRSGSEAFASIAEETRRLAEFAREATDTISRLASEIEYKVGETITAIHATSEDAKTSLAGIAGAAMPIPASARSARAQIGKLLDRARELQRGLNASSSDLAGGDPAAGPNSVQEHVENDPPRADKLPAEGILLIEGLKPGARLES